MRTAHEGVYRKEKISGKEFFFQSKKERKKKKSHCCNRYPGIPKGHTNHTKWTWYVPIAWKLLLTSDLINHCRVGNPGLNSDVLDVC